MDASDLLTPEITALGTEAGVIVAAAVGLGFGLLAVRRGVSWIRSFTRG
ncbi:MAG TPA: hypothetical protein VNT52_05970 [Acidimicrobiales bacterium]|nr:hypothetical protein [Acidimicrobiales bacterium]